MQKLPAHTWKFGNIIFHLHLGELFVGSVDAIVNSEQTDFVLSYDPGTISGQIRLRYGRKVQDELLRETNGRTQSPGTVIKTSGESYYKAIYHAGFHLPWNWLDTLNEEGKTEHVSFIRYCVRQILQRLRNDKIRSVAFPLIGCGLFNLDPKLLVYEFIAEIVKIAQIGGLEEGTEIYLCIKDEKLLFDLLDTSVQAIIDSFSPPNKSDFFSIGVKYIDLFEEEHLKSNHPQWSAWMLVRYAELITSYLFFNLANGTNKAIGPENITDSGFPFAFGKIRQEAYDLATNYASSASEDPWFDFFVELIRKDFREGKKLERLNVDRNCIAHGRAFRDNLDIKKDLVDFLCLPEWRKLRQKNNPPGIDRLVPWVKEFPLQSAQGEKDRECEIAVLERWDPKCWTYVVPHSGHTIKSSPPA